MKVRLLPGARPQTSAGDADILLKHDCIHFSQSNSFSAEHIADKSKAELSQTFVLFAPEHSNHISSTVLDDKRPIVRTLKEAD